MDLINIKFDLQFNDNIKINNIAIADQKEYFDKQDDYLIKGQIFIDVNYDLNEMNNRKTFTKDLELTLSKKTYNYQTIKLNINDYTYELNNNILTLNITYKIINDEMSLEKFCSLENDEIENKLKDYFLREQNNLNLRDDSIILLDPIIEEEPIPVEIKEPEVTKNEETPPLENETSQELLNEETQVDVPVNNDKDSIFKETYTTTFIYYRVKKGETIEQIAKKFHLDKEKIINHNHKEIKDNCLIMIPLYE